ncbi:RNB domain-containing ribonuclease [Nakamurella leprariae]|uniref:RNB domain-containing ribonuclease n=1 Tax=Nakamurella leprariae TaxID=2803911 RepID=A0A938YC99_9ACTN|nr:RNB domain-containing ribonuclease [Nakamurella leprariae]MBM9466956.1 RNB domain-containing ribonuclease [Nakamurella leprariae]
MPVPARSVATPPPGVDFDAIRAEVGIETEFPPEVTEQARRAAAEPPPEYPDHTDLPLVTIDPPDSLDLDQAVALARTDDGYRVWYAIADVAAFVAPDSPLDHEARRRGATMYSPDGSVPLHPRELSEAAASLLPDLRRPAVLWTIDLDRRGEPAGPDAVSVRRALVRSRAKLDYAGVQADLDAGRAHPSIELLPEIGSLREAAGRRRQALTLDLPDAEVVRAPDGHWTLELRSILPVERYNAQISLLTGTCAAAMMIRGEVGLLRTLPAPSAQQVEVLRRATGALGIHWPADQTAADVVARLDGSLPRDAAFLEDAVRLLRGAGYTAFDGAPPERSEHGGVGAPYAHVTAPLRRLADRFGSEICLALDEGRPVPDWVRTALPELPALMSAADRKASTLAKANQGAVSAFLLHGREGERFPATVLQVEPERDRAVVVLHEPPVRANCSADGLVEGTVVAVRLVSADPATHKFLVEPADGTPRDDAATLAG